MSKKALKEGYLSQIANVLLRPLTPYKPENQMLDEFHEILFDVENVKIINFKSTQKFKLPGLYKLTTYKRVPSMGDRNVKPNSLLTVRLDSTQGYIDVEFNDQEFSLNRDEWFSIQPYINEVQP